MGLRSDRTEAGSGGAGAFESLVVFYLLRTERARAPGLLLLLPPPPPPSCAASDSLVRAVV